MKIQLKTPRFRLTASLMAIVLAVLAIALSPNSSAQKDNGSDLEKAKAIQKDAPKDKTSDVEKGKAPPKDAPKDKTSDFEKGKAPQKDGQIDKTSDLDKAKAIQSGGRLDPIPSFSFRVEIDGVATSFGISVQEILSESEITQLRQGNSNTVTFAPGPLKPGRLEISSGVLPNNHDLFNWRQAVVTGQPSAIRTLSVVLMGANLKDLYRMNFYHCWPVKWKGPELNAKANSVAIESLELVYDRVEIK